MHKKVLSCLVYSFIISISFLLAGFTDAEEHPDKSFFSVPAVLTEGALAEILFLPSHYQQQEDTTEIANFCSLQPTGLYALVPFCPVFCLQSELLREFPRAQLLVYSNQFVCRQVSAMSGSRLFPALTTVPGLPVLLRTLRL